ncbi:HNH endonuclease [Candidatus Berkiella aquae]|uniref:HNH endonuclease n=1 Tax=Candidatus Berkiella aquae TaxID=295108 RepID=A0A0Q9YPD7_9GAMM|nr:HNH endonuclease signature motif containing protein [Candidatus Berkiella aquae]MCS5711960.1 HNH endonuclease [Candidatus Berkiella aquae]
MVKLVDFYKFAQFNTLRKLMQAELIQEFKFDSGISLLEEDFISRLDNEGIEIESLNEIEFRDDKTLGYKGQRVLIYIRDVNHYREEIKLPKFHIATCETLEKMWKNKRSERYVLYRRENGVFQVNVMKDSKIDIRYEKLNVCRNCLTHLNWENYTQERTSRNAIVADFSISVFFKRFSKSLLTSLPSHDSDTAPVNDYPDDWDVTSKQLRIKAGYRCESCKVCLEDAGLRQYLHVHHIDGQKNNNTKHNLKVLCAKCHADEPDHGHMKSSHDYKQFLSMYLQLKSKKY